MISDEELKEIVHQLEPVLGPQTRILWYRFINAKTAQRKEAIGRKIRLLGERFLDHYKNGIRLPPPSAEETNGEYQLGTIIYPDTPYSAFGLREEEFCKHIMITGMTGMGKTTAAIQILKEAEIEKKLQLAVSTFRAGRTTPFATRAQRNRAPARSAGRRTPDRSPGSRSWPRRSGPPAWPSRGACTGPASGPP